MTFPLSNSHDYRDVASEERDEHSDPATLSKIETQKYAAATIDKRHALLAFDVSQLTFSEKKTFQASQSLELNTLFEGPTWIIPVIQMPGSVKKEQTTSSEESLFRTLIKSISIYALASVMAPLSSLLIVPFLTRSLSRNDYGALAVLTTAISLCAGITQLGLLAAFLRAYVYDYESESDRVGVISMVVVILLLVSIPCTIAAVLMAPWLAQFLFNEPFLSDAVRIAAVLLLLQNLMVPGYTFLRVENRVVLYTIVSILNLLVNLVATVIFVGIFHMGINGALLAVGCGNVCVILCTSFGILKRIELRLRFDIAMSLLSFGLPLVPNFVSIWVLQLSDRFLLGRFASLAETAKYTVAYTLGGILGVIVLSPFSAAWYTAMFSIAKRENAPRIFQLVFRWYSLFLLFATGGLLLVSTATLYILFPPSYQSAAPVMPVVAVSIMFYGLYTVLTSGALLQRKNWLLLLVTILSAILNTGANIVLIPLYGSMGAAVSTFIAYTFLAIVTYVTNQRIYPIPFEVDMFSIALCIGVVLYIGCGFLTKGQARYTTWGIYICAYILYSGCLIALGKYRSHM